MAAPAYTEMGMYNPTIMSYQFMMPPPPMPSGFINSAPPTGFAPIAYTGFYTPMTTAIPCQQQPYQQSSLVIAGVQPQQVFEGMVVTTYQGGAPMQQN